MANIIIGKLGQKLLFDRNSKECQRSNTNGNVGAYLFFKLLIENNPQDTFYVIGENDLQKAHLFKNVIDVSSHGINELLEIPIDYGIFNISLLNESNPENKSIEYLNKSKTKWLLASDDPRCLNTKAKDILNRPTKIVGQMEGQVIFNDYLYDVDYIPIEMASVYGYKDNELTKDIDFTIVANDAGDFDRIGIIEEFTKGIEVDIYGRVSKETMESNKNFKGEIDFDKLQRIMGKTKVTFLVPIKEGWVTSKYVEALMNDVLPIMHTSYNSNLLTKHHWASFDVASTPEMLVERLSYYLENERKRQERILELKSVYVEPFKDGKILSYLIKKACSKM